MATTKITRKGQVTIPAEIRDKLNLKVGDVLAVSEVDGTVVLSSPADAFRRSLEKLWEFAQQHPSTPPVSPDEIDEIMADAAIEKYLASQDEG